MSWQTPCPWSHASCALVCTSVAPGTYATRLPTQDAMSAAASRGSAPATRCRAAPASPRSTVVRSVGVRYSSSGPRLARSASAVQGSGRAGPARRGGLDAGHGPDDEVTWGARMSNELTRVPQWSA